VQSLWTSLSAMKSSQVWLDRISNNIANEDTVGFAADRGSFADAFTQALTGNPGVESQAGRMTPPGWWGGTGVIPVSEEKDFSDMPLQRTDNPMDFAIQGDGFFAVQGSDGQLHLTKAGNFTWGKGKDGSFFLAMQSGEPVLDTKGGRIRYAGKGSPQMTIGADGSVTLNGRATGQKLAIVTVSMPGQQLSAISGNEFVLNPGAQWTLANRGGQNTGGSIQQGMLAMSNVDLTQEMADMIAAQRMFDLNAEAEQMTNRMMGDANQIRR
jgi:flagellar basal body rod protein FlgG